MRPIEEIKQNGKFKILTLIDKEGIIRIDGYYYDPVDQKRWYVIFTSSLGWEHASISQPNRTPTWDVMCRVKNIFWRDDEACVEYHPKKEDYVNMHEHCLHIWRPIESDLPTPPSIMVGFKDLDSNDTRMLSSALINSMSDEEKIEAAKNRGINIGNRQMKRKVGKK